LSRPTPSVDTLERLSREARKYTPALLGSDQSWVILWWALAAAILSLLVALATGLLHRFGWSGAVIGGFRTAVDWIGFLGAALAFVGLFIPLFALGTLRLRGRDPQAIMADRRREKAAAFARYIADRLDRSAIDALRRAATAEISRFERRKFMHSLLAGAGAVVAVIAKGTAVAVTLSENMPSAETVGPVVWAWGDLMTFVAASLAGGMTLGLLGMLDFIDRMNRILDALNEADSILSERTSPEAVSQRARRWPPFIDSLDASLRLLSRR
jgi:hypothetical protein